MSLKIVRNTSRKLKSTVMFVASFALALGSVSFATPQFFSQVAHATEPAVIVISNITELRSAVEHQADGQTWTINGGDYGLDRFNDVTAGGQTGWYLPITASNLIINGVGNPTLFGQEYSANGNWSSQNLVSVFGNNVTINGLTLMPKADPNKTVEVLGNDFILENTTITPNTKVAASVYDNIANLSDKAFAKQWGGSIYFSHAGSHLLKNVTVNNAGISFRYAPSGTNITFDNVNIVNQTNDNDINGYRYSSGFNNSGNTTVGAPKVTYNVNSTLNNLDSALASAQNGDTININSDLSTAKQITVTKALTINGNGNTISPTFSKSDSSNNSVIGIQSNGVTVNNLTVNGTGGTNLHGINVYAANDINLNDVTSKNNGNNGLVVNSSTVTVSNIHTSGNVWGGIDVDQKASASASLTVNGLSTHSEAGADIYVDDATKAVAVHDTNSQYGSRTSGLIGRSNDLVYKLKLAAPTALTPADNSFTNNPSFDNTWLAVSGAVKYEYETTYMLNGDAKSYSDTSDAGNYDISGSTIIRHNNNAPESTYTWKVRGVDALGIKGMWSIESKVTVDKTAPSTPTLLTPANNGFETTNDFYFTWAPSIDASSVKYEFQSSGNNTVDNGGSLVNSWNSISSGNSEQNNLTNPAIHSTGAGDGTYYWQVRAIDVAGNKSGWTTPLSMTIDSKLPVVNISSPSLNQIVKGRSLAINGTASDSGFNYYYCYVTGPAGEIGIRDPKCQTAWALGSQFKTAFSETVLGTTAGLLGRVDLNGVADGSYAVNLVAKDKAGNTSEVTQSFILDNTKPIVSFTSPTDFSTLFKVGPTVAVSAADTNGLKVLVMHVYNSSNALLSTCGSASALELAAGSMSCNLSGLPDGTYSIKAGVNDVAGNNTTISSGNFVIDGTAPIVTFGKPIMNSLTGSVTPVVNSGDATSYSWAAAGSNPAELNFTPTDKEPTFTPSVDGEYAFTLVAMDAAGNKSDAANFSFTYAAPVVLAPVVTTPAIAATVTAPAPAPAPLPQNLVAFAATPAATNDTAVLGATTTKDAPAVAGAQTKKVAAIATNNDGNGLTASWYWLLAIPAAIGAGWWATAAYRRRDV